MFSPKEIAMTHPRAAGTLFVLPLLLALAVEAAPALAGPIGFQASGGWYTENEEMFVGAGARFGFASITVIPNIEWLLVDHGAAYTLNVDGTMTVLPLGIASGYVGAGIGWFTVDPDLGDSSTNTAFNMIVGAGFNSIPLKPFAQLKYILVEGDDPLAFSIGARF
jgi:hypothetical protein